MATTAEDLHEFSVARDLHGEVSPERAAEILAGADVAVEIVSVGNHELYLSDDADELWEALA